MAERARRNFSGTALSQKRKKAWPFSRQAFEQLSPAVTYSPTHSSHAVGIFLMLALRARRAVPADG
jgi:hypothetical protein